MELTIYCPELHRDLTFSRPGMDYIYLDINNKPGTLGRQICEGGKFLGSTLGYQGDNQEHFNETCTDWYRDFLINYAVMQVEIRSQQPLHPYRWFGFPGNPSYRKAATYRTRPAQFR